MSEATFIGVKNVSGKDSRVQHGGTILAFAKDEVKVVEAGVGGFLLTRRVYVSEDIPNVGKRLGVKKLFDKVALTEALKVAKEPQNRSIAAAKKAAEDEEKREVEITEAVIARLKKEGWQPPKPAQTPPAK